MKTTLHKANDRGHVNHGWLNSHFSFSFSSYNNPDMMGFGTLRVINDDTIVGGQGFGMHSHKDMEIITIPTEGILEHKDNIGNTGTIKPGEVQVMSAGSGVMHSEYNGSKTETGKFFQIRIETRTPGISPYYDQKKFNDTEKNNQRQLLVSRDEREGSLKIHQDAYISRTYLTKETSLKYTLYSLDKKKVGLYVFVVSGDIQIDDAVLSDRDALAITDTDSIDLKSQSEADILIFEIPL